MTRGAQLRPAGAAREARRARGARRIAPFAYSLRPHARDRRGGALGRSAEARARRGRSVPRRPGPVLVALASGTGRPPSRTSPTRAGAIQLYFRKDAARRRGVRRARPLYDIGDVVGVSGPLFRTRTGEVTVRVERRRAAGQVAAPAAVRQGGGGRRRDRAPLRLHATRSSATGSATPTSRCIPRCARCSSRARG